MFVVAESTAMGIEDVHQHPDVVRFLKSCGILIEGLDAPPGRLIQKPFQAFPLDDRCLICCLDEHASFMCPFNVEVPKNATVGSGCDLVCKVCDRLFFGRCCNKDTGRAKLKFCDICFKYGEHWKQRCPRKHDYDLNAIGDPPGHLSALAARGLCPFRCVKKKTKINVA